MVDIAILNLVGGFSTPLKNDGVRQLGSIMIINDHYSHDGSMYVIYGNMNPINIPQSC